VYQRSLAIAPDSRRRAKEKATRAPAGLPAPVGFGDSAACRLSGETSLIGQGKPATLRRRASGA